jgi:hypothetical protein
VGITNYGWSTRRVDTYEELSALLNEMDPGGMARAEAELQSGSLRFLVRIPAVIERASKVVTSLVVILTLLTTVVLLALGRINPHDLPSIVPH